jgi:peptidoglycan hydrolase-like protein with peptidoglycan-binding domain
LNLSRERIKNFDFMAKKLVLGTLGAISMASLLLMGLPAKAAPASSKKPQHSSQPAMSMPKPASTQMSATSGAMSRSSSQQSVAVLRLGSRGENVKTLQTRLKQQKLYNGPVNGVFDRQTRSAVIAFQHSKKLHADGVVGSQTWTAIGS